MKELQLQSQPYDTAENWKQYNPLIQEGVICIEKDTLKVKVGDGIRKYNDLEYVKFDTSNALELVYSDELCDRTINPITGEINFLNKATVVSSIVGCDLNGNFSVSTTDIEGANSIKTKTNSSDGVRLELSSLNALGVGARLLLKDDGVIYYKSLSSDNATTYSDELVTKKDIISPVKIELDATDLIKDDFGTGSTLKTYDLKNLYFFDDNPLYHIEITGSSIRLEAPHSDYIEGEYLQSWAFTLNNSGNYCWTLPRIAKRNGYELTLDKGAPTNSISGVDKNGNLVQGLILPTEMNADIKYFINITVWIRFI